MGTKKLNHCAASYNDHVCGRVAELLRLCFNIYTRVVILNHIYDCFCCGLTEKTVVLPFELVRSSFFQCLNTPF